ncbi:hypothetical protein U8C32_21665 (plasmid) [Sinorhizobium medicae]|uniref:hypothetical protein n=1 Tax=Sinorhizobium medicae TaxID=110321 RepID=UPI002AF6B18B|nr:hypothetical protein [Sinorhizobium medicae]WQO48052.1 hypothetical protein U8C42_21760 [Sinorhizobium medicae]WQO68409.1 hypothetical protein U8C40_23030 [Sinorhizobium medicae]WQO75469.1 hypothetical protein U8C31_22795 [Sinorhizobium medicae]WQO94662.1 hypothetical protein U8C32_21665 [Sinorhizobium medicae]
MREYLDVIAEGLEAFRLSTNAETRQTFDDQVFASIEEFTPYRNEMIELFSAVAQYSPIPEQLETLRRFFEKCIPYFNPPAGVGSHTEWDLELARFV